MAAATPKAAVLRAEERTIRAAGADTIVGGASDDTVNGTAATLDAGDQLTGGAGTDVLALYGSGTYRVDQLAAFTDYMDTKQT